MFLATSIGVQKTALANNKAEAPHIQQMHNPTQMLELPVEEGVTKIVAASLHDLNAIYTPFSQISLTKNVNEKFTMKDNVIYFQPSTERPFSIYITQQGDPGAPTYKLTIGPSQVPVGQQIKLIPKEPYFPMNAKREEAKRNSSYSSSIISMLSDTARMLADPKLPGPDMFTVDEDFAANPFYIGNALISPDMKLIGSDYQIFVMTLSNRSNDIIQLVNSDFAEIHPETGLIDEQNIIQAKGVGFYPRQVLEPGAETHVIVIRSI